MDESCTNRRRFTIDCSLVRYRGCRLTRPKPSLTSLSQLQSLATSLTPATRTGLWHSSRKLGYAIHKPQPLHGTLHRLNKIGCLSSAPTDMEYSW